MGFPQYIQVAAPVVYLTPPVASAVPPFIQAPLLNFTTIGPGPTIVAQIYQADVPYIYSLR